MCKHKGECTAFSMITDLPLASDGICDTHGIHFQVTMLITKIVQVRGFDDKLIWTFSSQSKLLLYSM